MRITLDRLFDVKSRDENCERVTVEIGGLLVDLIPSFANGRPALEVRAVSGSLSITPYSSNSVSVSAFSDVETIEHARTHRALALTGKESTNG